MSNAYEKFDMSRTVVKRLEQYKDRWTSYGATSGILAISEKLSPENLKRFEIFRDYSDDFLEEISPDISIAKWKKGSILFEEGAYLDLAFYIVHGNIEVFVQKLQRRPAMRQPLVDFSPPLAAVGAKAPKSANGHAANPFLQNPVKKPNGAGSEIVFLSALDFDLPAGAGMILGPGEILGEIGAMNGWPQSVTARLASDGVVVQIRVPALRRMKRKSTALKQHLDKIYRERALFLQLKTTPLLQKCDDQFIERLAEKVELISCEPDEIIAKEGEPTDALYLVRSGFVKLSQKLSEGDIVVSYLSKGMTLGEVELLIDGVAGWTCTAAAVEFTDLVKISRDDLHRLIKKFPNIGKQLMATAVERVKKVGFSKKNLWQSEFIQTSLEMGLLEGNSILVIDLDACTRCDDCVRACADTHGGRPRFVREGDKYENLLITKSCYHCSDPVCLVGCPTGAIRRASVGEVVEIADELCIGCQACANNCPYDAIVMHETGEVWPQNMVPEILRGKARLLASKCDLCYKTNHGPACVKNCPHGCAFRVGSLAQFQKVLAKK